MPRKTSDNGVATARRAEGGVSPSLADSPFALSDVPDDSRGEKWSLQGAAAAVPVANEAKEARKADEQAALEPKAKAVSVLLRRGEWSQYTVIKPR